MWKGTPDQHDAGRPQERNPRWSDFPDAQPPVLTKPISPGLAAGTKFPGHSIEDSTSGGWPSRKRHARSLGVMSRVKVGGEKHVEGVAIPMESTSRIDNCCKRS